MRYFDLSGRKALVTGGSRGLGRAMAEAMLEAGAEAAILGSSEGVFATAQELGNAVPIQADLSKRDQLRRAFDECLEKIGTLDILIVSHGVQSRHPAEDFPSEDMEADTQRINDIIENWAREHPEQYLWIHRRFRTRPDRQDPQLY